ncbi:MAG TPA: MBOAT family O-acyltransferase [Myxococcota bacterium]|nr:MBOAT family O-acyltransferase [Myxococcota bacterium]HRY92407.1 MBOAT family O-acyltransferase [Myxococcota bacterium]
MLFVSFTFLFFLPLVLVGRWLLPGRAVRPFLLAASYAFYAVWGPWYALLLAGATLCAYLLGRGMGRWPAHRGALLGAGVAGALGTLGWFKYAGFLATQAWHLGRLLGVEAPQPALDIVLPVGISFYLFQLLSYLVDVKRGRAAEADPLRFALYVAFFPHLVAGPIVRADELLPQLHAPPPFDGQRFQRGVLRLLQGLLKKAVLADGLAAWVEPVFRDPAQASGLGLWTAVVGYAAQIYCDFSGYTDIALGAGQLLGFELPENFRYPYLALSPADFWRRWHLTLSRFLRDYLYIPLGGSRRGRARTDLNLLLTMLLGGLWHGAAWRFVLWGGYHGLLLVLHRAWRAAFPAGSRLDAWRGHGAYRALAGLLCFAAVTLGWVFFRARDLPTAFAVLGGLCSPAPHLETPAGLWKAWILLAVVALGHALGPGRVLERVSGWLPAPARGLLWALMLALLWLFASAAAPFIYFQF